MTGRTLLPLALVLSLALHDADGRVGTVGVCDLEPVGRPERGVWVEDARGRVVAHFLTPAEASAWIQSTCAGDF